MNTVTNIACNTSRPNEAEKPQTRRVYLPKISEYTANLETPNTNANTRSNTINIILYREGERMKTRGSHTRESRRIDATNAGFETGV